MKKMENDGFVLIETIVVAVIVLGIFMMIYENLVPAIGESEVRLHYDDVDTVYAANTFKNLLASDDNFEAIMSEVKTNGYIDLTNCNVYSIEKSKSMCTTLKNELGITEENRIYLVSSSLDSLLGISDLPRGLYDYVNYLKDSNELDNRTGYTLLLSRTVTFTSRYDDTTTKDINYYANIVI